MTAERPLAALDVGSNTIRLLVGAPRDGQIERLCDRSEFVRLGYGVEKTGRLDPERMWKALGAILAFTEAARELGADKIVAFATSAVRDAADGPEFAARVLDAVGLDLEILSGEREAELTFIGATLGVDVGGGAIVCDLGGGSAELIYADADGMRWARSEPLGSGRLSERFIKHDPPDKRELAAVADHVRAVLAGIPPAQPQLAIFTGGTASHIAAMIGGGSFTLPVSIQQLDDALAVLSGLSAAEVVARYGFRVERAQVLPAGVCTIRTIAAAYGAERIVITRSGIREGAMVDHLRRAGASR